MAWSFATQVYFSLFVVSLFFGTTTLLVGKSFLTKVFDNDDSKHNQTGNDRSSPHSEGHLNKAHIYHNATLAIGCFLLSSACCFLIMAYLKRDKSRNFENSNHNKLHGEVLVVDRDTEQCRHFVNLIKQMNIAKVIYINNPDSGIELLTRPQCTISMVFLGFTDSVDNETIQTARSIRTGWKGPLNHRPTLICLTYFPLYWSWKSSECLEAGIDDVLCFNTNINSNDRNNNTVDDLTRIIKKYSCHYDSPSLSTNSSQEHIVVIPSSMPDDPAQDMNSIQKFSLNRDQPVHLPSKTTPESTEVTPLLKLEA